MDKDRIANGGDLLEAGRAFNRLEVPGALLRVEAPHNSQRNSEQAGRLVKQAWEEALTRLPPDSVGVCSWYQFEIMIAGSKTELLELMQSFFDWLLGQAEFREHVWHIVIIRLFETEPLRTLRCDPNYDLDSQTSLLAWVDPYDAADWRESQKYPTTTLVRTL